MKKNTKNKIITLSLFLIMFIVLTIPTLVLAQATYTPLVPLEPTPAGQTPAPTNLGNYIDSMVKILIGIAGVLAVIMIMIGGIQYMSTDAISGKQEGKERITQALFGLGLAIASYLILYTISPTLLQKDLTVGGPDPLGPSNPTPGKIERCLPPPSTGPDCVNQRRNELQQLQQQISQRSGCTITNPGGVCWDHPVSGGTEWCYNIEYNCVF